MTVTVHLVLVVVALVCFGLAAFFSSKWSQVNLVAAGLFFWLLASSFVP
jgi:hypothetical protein